LLLVIGYLYGRIGNIDLIVHLRPLSSQVRGSWQESAGSEYPPGERSGTVVSLQTSRTGVNPGYSNPDPLTVTTRSERVVYHPLPFFRWHRSKF